MPRGRWFAVAVACALAARTGRPAFAEDDVPALRAALAREDDPDRRLTLVARLAAVGGPAAAVALAKVVKGDAEASVRAAAARSLGRIDAENALDLLAERVVEGGPRAAREAVARALARRAGAAARVKKALDDPKTSEGERILWLHALAAFHDEATRAALVANLRADAPGVREAAARALTRRRDARLEVLPALLRFLDAARDKESMLVALDSVEPALDLTMRPFLARLAVAPDPAVREAAEHLLDALRRGEAAKGAKPPPAPALGDRYAPPADGDEEPPPPPPPDLPPRARFDVVYVVDVTGSASTTIEGLRKRIGEETGFLAHLGASVRVGVVGYRGGRGAEARRLMDVLLPSFDLDRVSAFLRDLQAVGVDERGAAVAPALAEALDRTPWRWDARREVRLLADSLCDDPQAAAATVGVHFRSDATRTSVGYVLRTRPRVPAEYADISRLGGGGVPEAIR